MPRKDVMRPIKPAEEIKNGSITVATSEASFQNRDPDVNQYTPSGEIVSGNRDRFDNINYYEQDGKVIPIVGQTPAAAYSLRALSGRSNASVVRLRRESDDAEKDFNAREAVAGTAGSELVTNGGFDTDLSGWTAGAGWSRAYWNATIGHVALADGSQVARSTLLQNGIYGGDVIHIVTFRIVSCSDFTGAGTVMRRGTVQSFSALSNITSPGTYTRILSNESNATFGFYADAGVTLAIDNVSLKTYTASSAESWAIVESTLDIRGITGSNESAYVTTWYDQSGNGNDATQSTQSTQPLFILAGVTNVSHGKPALKFRNGTDARLVLDNHILSVSGEPFSSYCVADVENANGVHFLYDGGNGFAGPDAVVVPTGIMRIAGTTPDANIDTDNNVVFSNGQFLYTAQMKDFDIRQFVNGVQELEQFDSVIGTYSTFYLGGSSFSGQWWQGNIHEAIFYNTDQSANRTKIEKSINDYYNIYAYPDKPLISDVNPATSAAYSLRNLTDYPTETPVVRVRRGSDDAERDFKPMDIVAGTSGSELVTNGDFATDSDWSKGTGWSITGGRAVCDGSQASITFLSQGSVASPEVNGQLFLLEFTVVACSDFNRCGVYLNNTTALIFSTKYEITSTGTYNCLVEYSDAANSSLNFFAFAGETLTVDNVSCKPYTPSAVELWSIENGLSNRVSRQNTDSAFCTTWYDQSGNGNHVTQATQSNQPKLITAGVMNTDNGKPALEFDGTDDVLSATVSPGTAVASVAMVWNKGNGNNRAVFDGSNGATGTNRIWRDFPNAGTRFLNGASTLQATNSSGTDTQNLTFIVNDGAGNGSIADNGETPVTGTMGTSTMSAYRLGGGLGGINFINSYVQELVIYQSDQSAKRTSIENQINSYYGIY